MAEYDRSQATLEHIDFLLFYQHFIYFIFIFPIFLYVLGCKAAHFTFTFQKDPSRKTPYLGRDIRRARASVFIATSLSRPMGVIELLCVGLYVYIKNNIKI